MTSESPGERILKISTHLPKILSNIKWLTLLEQGVLHFIAFRNFRLNVSLCLGND